MFLSLDVACKPPFAGALAVLNFVVTFAKLKFGLESRTVEKTDQKLCFTIRNTLSLLFVDVHEKQKQNRRDKKSTMNFNETDANRHNTAPAPEYDNDTDEKGVGLPGR